MEKKNRLAGELSPYLLQHSTNTVDWYPWCDEAFDKAREEELINLFLSLSEEELGHYNLLQAEKNSLIDAFYWFDMDSTTFMED